MWKGRGALARGGRLAAKISSRPHRYGCSRLLARCGALGGAQGRPDERAVRCVERRRVSPSQRVAASARVDVWSRVFHPMTGMPDPR
jgi:hypothetical protein